MNQHSFSPPRTTGEQIPFSVLPARGKQVEGGGGDDRKKRRITFVCDVALHI